MKCCQFITEILPSHISFEGVCNVFKMSLDAYFLFLAKVESQKYYFLFFPFPSYRLQFRENLAFSCACSKGNDNILTRLFDSISIEGNHILVLFPCQSVKVKVMQPFKNPTLLFTLTVFVCIILNPSQYVRTFI